MSKGNKPKIKTDPVSRKEVRVEKIPESNRNKKPSWQIGLIDIDGAWGWKSVAGDYWWNNISAKLKDYESMTWQEIYDATGW